MVEGGAVVSEAEGREVEVMLTVYGPQIGFPHKGHIVTETFPATVQTRLIYEGRAAFLAADPVAEPEEVSA
jgi:hypothetical protein